MKNYFFFFAVYDRKHERVPKRMLTVSVFRQETEGSHTAASSGGGTGDTMKLLLDFQFLKPTNCPKWERGCGKVAVWWKTLLSVGNAPNKPKEISLRCSSGSTRQDLMVGSCGTCWKWANYERTVRASPGATAVELRPICFGLR